MGQKSIAAQAALATAAAGLCLFNHAPAANAQAPVVSWTGFYGGLYVGGTWQDVGYRNPSFYGDVDADGFSAGAIFGYNYQVAPQWVLGIEASGGFTGINKTERIGGSDLTTESPYELTGRLRLGYLVNQQTLVYGAGGFAASKQWISFPNQHEHLIRTGYTVGGGAEFGNLFPGLHLRGEYNFTSYGTKTFFNDLPVRLDQHAVRLLISTVPRKAPPPIPFGEGFFYIPGQR